METQFGEIKPEQILDNPFKLIGDDWMLITAGMIDSFNTMTANWGGLGVLWEKKICTCFIRPQRFTYQFIEKSDFFTLSFFDEQYRSKLDYCGSHSGKNVDKMAATGLTPLGKDGKIVYFNEARLVLVCKKIYFQDLQPQNFLSFDIQSYYPKKDYHRMFIGEVVQCLTK